MTVGPGRGDPVRAGDGSPVRRRSLGRASRDPPSPSGGSAESSRPVTARSPRPALRTATRLALRRSRVPRAPGRAVPPMQQSARLNARGGRVLSPRPPRAVGSVTHSPERSSTQPSPRDARACGARPSLGSNDLSCGRDSGDPLRPPCGAIRGATRPISSAALMNAARLIGPGFRRR